MADIQQEPDAAASELTFFDSVRILAELCAIHTSSALNVVQKAVVSAAKNGKQVVLIGTGTEGSQSYAQVQALLTDGFDVSIASTNTVPGAVKPITFQVRIPWSYGESGGPPAVLATAAPAPQKRAHREGGSRSGGRTKKRRTGVAVLASDAAADATAAATAQGLEEAANAAGGTDVAAMEGTA